MHVRVVRRGGFAGIPLSGETDTRELPHPRAALAEEALLGLSETTPPAPPSRPDGFQYKLDFASRSGASRSVVIDETEVSDALRPIIDTAMGRGTLGQ